MNRLNVVVKQYYRCPDCGKIMHDMCSCGYIRGTMTKEEKAKFRKTPKWRAFRKQISDTCSRDVITKKLLRRDWNLHHLDMNDKNYTDLSNKHKFAPLNKDTHEFVHWLFRLYRHDKQIIDRLKKMMEAMYEYTDREKHDTD